ncbi:unnamed protein product [Thelazia callipaeda]|uniref:Death domain-containing protein n=1 Tax=Thelazia callipaeda TaxID=103827 RepID=A0A158RBQ8_THECL|nr:unnamed protein product [Thelazia callipaeda]
MDKAVLAMDLEDIKMEYKKLKEDGDNYHEESSLIENYNWMHYIYVREKYFSCPTEIIRLTVENALHQKAFEIQCSKASEQENLLRQLLALTFEIAKEDFCSKGTTVTIMQDVFDAVSIERCEELFVIVEESLDQWKVGFFFEPCKNMILRMCNDLLKRLSRTLNTSFCGRILVLLAHALPLCEKSGLNLVSHFNLDNITSYELIHYLKYQADPGPSIDEPPEEDSESMEVGEINEREATVDHTLYAKFWLLQTFFASPAICFEKSKWKTFQQNTSEILNVLSSYKLESPFYHDEDLKRRYLKQEFPSDESTVTPSTSKIVDDDDDDGDVDDDDGDDYYCAKYLTSHKLLQWQLNDSRFRRCFLLQCLILYQYLVSDIKFKDKSFILNDEQLRFIIESTEKCFRLLRETHPEGSTFSEAIRAILYREKEWSEWKNRGCFDYTQLVDKEKGSFFKRRTKQKYDPSQCDLGNSELTRLWNINPDMLSACEDPKRNFIPDLRTFLENRLDELDPKQLVEEQYQLMNNEMFQWRASRLLMSQSASYFQMPPKKNEVVANLAPFLNEVIKQTASEIPELKDRFPDFENISQICTEVVSDNVPSSVPNGKERIEASAALTDSHIEQLAPILAESWLALAHAMDVPKEEDDILEEPIKITQSILMAWKQKEGSGATIKRFSSVLLMAELFSEQIGQIFRSVCF